MPSHGQSPALVQCSALRLLCVGRVGKSPDSYATAVRPPHAPCSAAAATRAAPSSPRLVRFLPDRALAPPRVGSHGPWAARRVTNALLRAWPKEDGRSSSAVPPLLLQRAFRGRSLAAGLPWPLSSNRPSKAHESCARSIASSDSILHSITRAVSVLIMRRRGLCAHVRACGAAIMRRRKLRGRRHRRMQQ
jgi:hypothetical protein